MKNDVITILKKVGAILTDDHFVYTSGKHGSIYINKDALYPHTLETSKVGKIFAEKFKNKKIDVVAGPSLGGIILSQWTAYHLSKILHKDVHSVYTEKDKDQNQIFTRGYDKLIFGKNVLVIEDLTTTGASVAKVVKSVKLAGGNVISVCVMVNRDPEITSQSVGAPFSYLSRIEAQAFDASACPLCQKGIIINTSVGHGRKYLAERKNI